MKELKEAVAGPAAMPADEMRLIFKGKILNDEKTLPDYKIENGMTVHLVKGKSASSAQPSSGSAGASQANPSQP